MEVLDSLDPLLRTFWYVAIPTSLIFAVQSVMTFMGVDSGDGLEADFDGDFSGGDAPFQLFSLRNLINFLLGFSWTGISLFNTIENVVVLILVSAVVGAFFVYFFFLIIRQLLRLSENNSFRINHTLHKTAEVYLTIPGQKSGRGKVLVSVNGATHELDAMTENEQIDAATLVRVVRIENNSILFVEKI